MAFRIKNKNAFSKTNKSKNITLQDIAGGSFLTGDFFGKNAKLIAMILFMVFFYISNRYECQQKMIEIVKLQKKLSDVKYEALTRSSELVGGSKQSQVKGMIVEKGIEIEESETPPYQILIPQK